MHDVCTLKVPTLWLSTWITMLEISMNTSPRHIYTGFRWMQIV